MKLAPNFKSLLVIVSVLAFTKVLAQQNTSKPNIIVLFEDDISARELPIYSNTVWGAPKENAAFNVINKKIAKQIKHKLLNIVLGENHVEINWGRWGTGT